MNEDDLFYSWFSGFIDGEGCFSLKLSKDEHFKYGIKITPSFQLGLVDYDKAVLEKIKEKMGGKIYLTSKEMIVKHAPYFNHLKQHGRITLTFTNRKEFDNLIKIIDSFPLKTKKQNDFELWKKGIAIYYSKTIEFSTKQKILEICKIRDEMNNGFDGKKMGKYRSYNNILEYITQYELKVV
jgi:hypothetical protein